MKIRWTQHKEQGGNSIISLKKRLPRVAPVTNNQQTKMMLQVRLPSLMVRP
jgi:hypothetical protein